MNLHKKIHRMLLLICFIYLTICPHSYEVTAGFFKYNAIGNKIESLEQRTHRERELQTSAPHTMAELAFVGNIAALESAHMLCSAYHYSQKIKANPLSSVKLQL